MDCENTLARGIFFVFVYLFIYFYLFGGIGGGGEESGLAIQEQLGGFYANFKN